MAATDEPTGCAQASAHTHPGVYPRIDFDSLDEVTARIEQEILDAAPTWEQQFDAGPGRVVSVSDAARVIARKLLTDAAFNELRVAEMAAYPLRAQEAPSRG